MCTKSLYFNADLSASWCFQEFFCLKRENVTCLRNYPYECFVSGWICTVWSQNGDEIEK